MAELNIEDDLSYSMNIWTAASDGLIDEVKEFVKSGVSVNAADEFGYTPIQASCSYCHTELTKWLIEVGASVTQVDMDGDSPLHYCESTECAELLVAAGADIFAVNSEGETPYHHAVLNEREEIIAWLEKKYREKGLEPPVVEIDDEDDMEGEEDE